MQIVLTSEMLAKEIDTAIELLTAYGGPTTEMLGIKRFEKKDLNLLRLVQTRSFVAISKLHVTSMVLKLQQKRS